MRWDTGIFSHSFITVLEPRPPETDHIGDDDLCSIEHLVVP